MQQTQTQQLKTATPTTMPSNPFRTAKRYSNFRANILALETLFMSILYVYKIETRQEQFSFPQALLLEMFGIVYMIRLNFMARWLLPRELALEEITVVPFVWLASIMTSFIVKSNNNVSLLVLFLSLLFYSLGSYLNTYSELQRKWWKQNPKHKGKCYMEGLFANSRNINYFGDTVLFAGWAMATGELWNVWVPLVMGLAFWFYHIPDKEQYLAVRYKEEWPLYTQQTPYAFVPFVC